MLTTRKLVWIRQVKHLADVFWTAMTIATVRLLVSQLLRRNTRNALARFDFIQYLNKTLKYFLGKLSTWMPM